MGVCVFHFADYVYFSALLRDKDGCLERAAKRATGGTSQLKESNSAIALWVQERGATVLLPYGYIFIVTWLTEKLGGLFWHTYRLNIWDQKHYRDMSVLNSARMEKKFSPCCPCIASEMSSIFQQGCLSKFQNILPVTAQANFLSPNRAHFPSQIHYS